MAGQLWGTNSVGGFMYSDELSDYLRLQNFPLTKWRPLADAKDFSDKGYHSGDTVHWNIYEDVATQGTTLTEGTAIPETNFQIKQGTATISEWGNAVPFTGKLDDLSSHPVKEIINKVLRRDVVKAFDTAVWNQIKLSKLRVVGTSETAITLTTNGTATATNTSNLSNSNLKSIVDTMKERDIPAYQGDDYIAIARPTTWRPLKDDLETIESHTTEGFQRIINGLKGRYYGCQFVEQTHIAAAASGVWTTSNASDWAVFMGEDTCAEIIVRPEEIRGKIPTDFGRSRGVAWYAEEGFSLVHKGDGTQGRVQDARVVIWDSAA